MLQLHGLLAGRYDAAVVARVLHFALVLLAVFEVFLANLIAANLVMTKSGMEFK